MSFHGNGVAARRQVALPDWARPDIIPAELRERPQWVVWRSVVRGGKPTKEPYQAANPRLRAKTNDPSTWAAYEIAVAAASAPENKLDGIGFVFSADDPYAGIDFDDCLINGELMPWALDYIQAMQGAYGEISPSGQGIKLFVRASLPPPGTGKNRKGFGDDGTGGIEVYDRKRFFTVTGNRFCGDGPIADCSELVNRLYARLAEMADCEKKKPAKPEPAKPDRLIKARRAGSPSLEDRAIAYLHRAEPAVSGQNGHGKTFGLACRFGPGFDLPKAVAKRLLMEHYNPRCEPPWSEAEIDHKIEDAYRIETRRGWLLNAPSKNGDHQRNGKPATQEGGREERLQIEITTREHEVVDHAIGAISREPNLYQRARSLVSVIDDVKPESKAGIERPSGTPRIVSLPNAQIRRLLSVHATWCRERTDRNGNLMLVDTHIPPWVVEMVSTMGTWNSIRPMIGITEIPTFRPNGSLITKPGYDPETGLLYRPNIQFPEIPRKPSRDEAREASETLLDIVEDFPFYRSKTAWLAALLTPMARYAIDGPTPLFLIDANVAGAGKTKLVDLVAILNTGRGMARGNYSSDDVEMHKTLLSIALAGDQLVLFDNIPGGGSIGGPALDRFLTARTMNGRILGRSEMTGELDVNTVLFATGNNLGLKGDSLRRIVPIPLQSPEERPEERQHFTIKGDLLKYAKEHRARLVAAALTILRAYIEAGQPDQNLTPMDYAAWCGLIRNAINWATGTDPCEGRRELIANDDETNKLKVLVEGWKQLCELSCMSALSVVQALKVLDDYAGQTQALREVLLGWSKDGRLPSSRTIGNQLSRIKGRNLGGNALNYGTTDGYRVWYVKPVR